jgi:hypothetical protein
MQRSPGAAGILDFNGLVEAALDEFGSKRSSMPSSYDGESRVIVAAQSRGSGIVADGISREASSNAERLIY